MVNLLLTSVGRRVELVRHLRDGFERCEVEGRIVATDIDWLAPALQEVDRFHLVPSVRSPDYIPQLCEICRLESIDLVLPLIDPDIPRLAQHRHALEETGAQICVVDPPAAAISSDKWKAFRFFRDLGLPTPQSWLPAEALREPPSQPLFIKPRNGSAGVDAFPVRDADDLRFFAKYVPHAIIQEYLPGPEITSDVICDLEGEVLAVVSRKRIAVRGGEAVKSVTITDPRIHEACCQIAQALPARGPLTVQCMLKDGVPHFIEINARLGGGLPLAMAAGVDVPAILIMLAADRSVREYVPQSYRTGVYMTRCDESFFLTEAFRDAFARHPV